jgi:enoyl-CoA hydratase/carnithine racemase
VTISPSSDYQTILIEQAGSVAWITLDRPDNLNTINDRMTTEIGDALDRCEADDVTSVLVLTGSGRAFCAGADLAPPDGGEVDPSAMLPFIERTQDLLIRLRDTPMVVIAAINGITMGGGLELALAADIVVAAADARIGDGHANVGVIPGAGGATVLPRRISPGLAKYLLFTGDTVSAEDLRTAGLVARVFPSQELRTGTQEIADRIAARSPLAHATVKRLVTEGLAAPDEAEAIRAELRAMRTYAHSHDMAEGVRAFLARRPPVFLGR